jgi:hypothetical protein
MPDATLQLENGIMLRGQTGEIREVLHHHERRNRGVERVLRGGGGGAVFGCKARIAAR